MTTENTSPQTDPTLPHSSCLNRRQQSTPPAAYIDAAGVASILGIAEKTVRNWASLRLGPPQYRFGGAARYSITEVYDWAAAQKVGE
ncbi:helix-turn-helix domain-containing protein [Rhodoglobus sp.]